MSVRAESLRDEMSWEHTAMVWEMIRSGEIDGGVVDLVVLLYLADQADKTSGERPWPISTRRIAEMLGVGDHSVRRALRTAESAGIIATERGRGPRASQYRFVRSPTGRKLYTVPTGPSEDIHTPPESAVPQPRLARSHNRAFENLSVSSNSQFFPQGGVVHSAPADAAIALAVGVEIRIETLRGTVWSPDGLARRIGTRLAQQEQLDRLRPDVDVRDLAVSLLRSDGLDGVCPMPACGARDARPHTEPKRCSTRGERCPYLVPAP